MREHLVKSLILISILIINCVMGNVAEVAKAAATGAKDVMKKLYTNKVWMNIKVGHRAPRKVIFGLFGDIVPKTCENFRALCTGEKGNGTQGKPLHYKGSKFYNIESCYGAFGGDIIHNNGSGGESIYGMKFADENFKLNFDDKKYLLATESDQ